MIEKPDLSDENIRAGLSEGYGLAVQSLAFLPIGNDSSAWAYYIRTAQADYFLKLRRGAVYEPGLLVPRFLREQGIEAVVAPLPARSGRLWHPAGKYHLILYPFLEGRSGMDAGLSAPQWRAFGALLRRIHETRPPESLLAHLPRESFRPWWAPAVRRLQQIVAAGAFIHPLERELAAFWQPRTREIERITMRAEELGRMAQEMQLAPVLCHADIHTANLLVDSDGRLAIVDWDQVLLAPVERDLMFVTGAEGAPPAPGSEEDLFFSGYGPVLARALPLAYYRYEWVVQEIGDYGERVFLHPNLGEETRREAVREFIQLFAAGNVVEGAYAAEKAL
jgi:spectinomycin phosphotransferase